MKPTTTEGRSRETTTEHLVRLGERERPLPARHGRENGAQREATRAGDRLRVLGDPRFETEQQRRDWCSVMARADAEVLARIKEKFGDRIPPAKMAKAQESPARFFGHEVYQQNLRDAFPDLTPQERERILGDLRDGQPCVDAQDFRLMTTVAHERLHELAHPRFRAVFGKGLYEGLTEFHARQVSSPIEIAGEPQCYRREYRLIQMLRAEVGAGALERAYFRGDTDALTRSMDARFGAHTADRVAALAELGPTFPEAYDEAEKVLKQVMERPGPRATGPGGSHA
jgi:hypothetical protein